MNKLSLLFFALLTICNVSAQETVRLTVSGQGATKEEATANALRSAIEQSFGVFVSANTQILNDEVVKDEIATIASGNIKEFKELGCITLPNGDQSISLSATVSIGNLISYAKSKGSSAEFAGQVFAMNMKMRKLNAENEKIAIEHMLEQLDILAKDMFRIEISTSGQPIRIDWNDYDYSHLKEKLPSQPYFIDLRLDYYATPTCKIFYDLLFNSLSSISLSEDEVKIYKESGEPIYGLSFRQAVSEDIQIFGVGSRDLESTVAYEDQYRRGAKEFKLSVYFFRNNIVGDILSSIYRFFLNAQLAEWQVVRKFLSGAEESITFESIDRKSDVGKTDLFHYYWDSHPDTRPIECVNKYNGFGGNSFPFVNVYNYFAYGEEQIRITNLQMMIQNPNKVFAMRNIRIAFTEEEIGQTTGFEIRKNENKNKNNTNDSILLDDGLRNRGLVGNLSMPTYVSGVNAKIVIRVAVDNDGRVTSARYESKGSTSSDLALIKASENAAKQARFTESTDFIQGGWITYNFK